jgi:hypothetical protein
LGYSSSLVIEELNSNRVVQRTLTLLGPGLPKQGANWGFENALVTTWYPGNPDQATQQMLVAKEMPSNWEGEWHLTLLNRKPQKFEGADGSSVKIISPGALVDLFEDIGRRGLRLRVTWLVSSSDVSIARKIVREGRIKHFEAKYRTSVDLEWSVEFSWMSRGLQQSRTAGPAQDPNVNSASNNLIAAGILTQAAVAALISAQNSPTAFTLGQLEQIAEYPLELLGTVNTQIENALFSLNQISGIVTQFKNLPYNMASQAVGVAADVVDSCHVFTDSFTRTPVEKQVLSDQVASLSSSMTDLGAVDDSMALTARAAQQTQAQLRTMISTNGPGGGSLSVQTSSGMQPGTVLAIRLTRRGDTPQSLSQLYYGTVDHDLDILRANNLPWHQVSFDPGSILVIPALAQSNTSSTGT